MKLAVKLAKGRCLERKGEELRQNIKNLPLAGSKLA
jgi:hypothetical protein